MKFRNLASRRLRIATKLLLTLTVSVASQAWAQHELVGKYKGEYWEPSDEPGAGYPKKQEALLEITAIQDGQVSGRYTLTYHYCSGTYAVHGTMLDNTLELTTGEGPRRDCAGQKLRFQAQAGKLVGNTSAETPGRRGLTLSKQ